MQKPTRLARHLDALEALHGPPTPPTVTAPFQQLLLEHVAYLADDATRAAAFARLAREVGLSPREILDAPIEDLAAIARAGGGIAATQRAERMQRSAARVLEEWDGDLDAVLALPRADAEKRLRRFESIGPPGAQKILLLAGAQAVLALDSNALRVLLRLGYGQEGKSYATTYRAVQAAAESEVVETVPARRRAHSLLRTHGQTVCRNTAPRCGDCPLVAACPSAGGR